MTEPGGVGNQDTTVREVHASAYTIPTDTPEADGTLAWTSTTLILVTACAGDETGFGWTYGPPAGAGFVNDELAAKVCGCNALDVGRAFDTMVKSVRNAGRAGVGGYAISAVDIACGISRPVCWDWRCTGYWGRCVSGSRCTAAAGSPPTTTPRYANS